MRKKKDSFWEVQALKSFCKAKTDWLRFERIHLSFVQHEGKDNSCKQILAIEGALKVHGADGALFLSDMILSGAAKKLADKSKEIAQKEGKNYPSPIFVSMGGTTTSRSKDGKAVFRQFSLIAGKKSDFVFQMLQCEGEESSTGGVQRKKGVQAQSINVPLSAGDLFDFARSIQIEWMAFRTMCMNGEGVNYIAPSEEPEDCDVVSDNVHQELPSSSNKEDSVPTTVALIYDDKGYLNNGYPIPVKKENAIAIIQSITKEFLNLEGRLVADPSSYQQAVAVIEKWENNNIAVIRYIGKKDETKTCNLVVRVCDVQ